MQEPSQGAEADLGVLVLESSAEGLRDLGAAGLGRAVHGELAPQGVLVLEPGPDRLQGRGAQLGGDRAACKPDEFAKTN